MKLAEILNLIAIIIIPIIAVIIGQWLQTRSEKRKDKMHIFKTLMTSRVYGWTQESVIACIPAIITGIITYLVACKNAKSEIKKIELDFQHKLELLDKTTNNNVAENVMDKVLTSVLESPEMKKKISQSVRNVPSNGRRK